MELLQDKGFFHTLGEGEDIWLLAELYYGDASLWWIIYHVNLEVFGDDPEHKNPGLKVYVPHLRVKEEHTEVPTFIVQTAAEPSFDPMIHLATDIYEDPTMCFDIYSLNNWEPDHVIVPGERISYPARAAKPAMRRAERWRHIFYRS